PNKFVQGAWTYDLVVTPDPGISGYSSSISGITDISITDYLTNSDPVARKVKYHFTPNIDQIDGDGPCGDQQDTTIIVWVNPSPDIEVTANPDTVICNGQFINFFIQNPNTSIEGTWQYDLKVTVPHPAISGARGDSTFYEYDDLPFSDQLFNFDTAVHEVIYQFIPRITPNDGDPDCENGHDTTITIWVNPTPRIIVNVEDTIFCNNDIVDFTIIDGLAGVIGDKKYIVEAIYVPGNVTVYSRASGDTSILNVPQPISDSLVNHTNEVQPVFYFFRPRIFDNRDSHEGEFCGNVPDIIITIWVNPTPVLLFDDLPDTIFCDSALVNIKVTDGLSSNILGTHLYDLEVIYNSSEVSGVISPDGPSATADEDITNYLLNGSDTIQVISYRFTARIRDDRPGHEGEDCTNGTDTTITIYLNPTPRIDYQYLLGHDTICYTEGFRLATNSLVWTTHDMYYKLFVNNPDGMTDVIVPPDSSDAAVPLEQGNIWNPGLEVGIIEYNFRPFISVKGCPGKDTSIFVRVNPEPVMAATQSDTAVCFNWGYNLPMNTPVISTTGAMRYQLYTGGYNPGNVGPIPGDNDYFIDTLDQSMVVNIGDSIENVTYYITPFIQEAREGFDCPGSPLDSIIVQVAPELKGDIFSDTTEFGGFNITCFGLDDGSIDPN
ncbi:MAG: hypothetical protein KAT15_27690, partial [Bacteroidales bacterium]|nr:hypothetical protein [Bacteroidales bacterium]